LASGGGGGRPTPGCEGKLAAALALWEAAGSVGHSVAARRSTSERVLEGVRPARRQVGLGSVA